MKRVKILLLLICWLVLANVIVVAQESTVEAQEKAKARAAELRKRAAAKAAAEQALADAKATELEKKAAAKAAAQQARTAAKVYLQRRRAEQRASAEHNRMRLRMQRTFSQAKKPRPDGTFKFLWARPTVNVSTVIKGAPYSAKAITEHTQTLSDGNQIIHRNEATYYRDSEGRLRIERALKTIGKWATEAEPATIITIWDPLTGTYYSLDPRTRTAFKNPSGSLKVRFKEYQKVEAEYAVKVKQFNEMKSKLSGLQKEKEKLDSPKPTSYVRQESDDRRKKESLGKEMIEGVAAEGTRSTQTIPAGQIGNVRAIEIVDERWYSHDLQLLIRTKHQDPRSGETIYRLTNINRNEPARLLFEVPADYRVVEKYVPKIQTNYVEQKKVP